MTYREWCAERGVNPYHPDEWSDADRAAHAAWKLQAYKDKLAGWKAFNMPAIVREHHGVDVGNDRIREVVQEALGDLRRPPKRRPYLTCPCHRFSPVRAKPRAEMAHGLSYITSFAPKGRGR